MADPRGTPMPDPTASFFDGLARSGHVPTLEGIRATIRFDLGEEQPVEHWLVSISDGDIAVSQEDHDADCVIGMSRESFRQMAGGKLVPQAAFLRNELNVTGKFQLLIVMGRFLPPIPGNSDPRELVSREGRRS